MWLKSLWVRHAAKEQWGIITINISCLFCQRRKTSSHEKKNNPRVLLCASHTTFHLTLLKEKFFFFCVLSACQKPHLSNYSFILFYLFFTAIHTNLSNFKCLAQLIKVFSPGRQNRTQKEHWSVSWNVQNEHLHDKNIYRKTNVGKKITQIKKKKKKRGRLEK